MTAKKPGKKPQESALGKEAQPTLNMTAEQLEALIAKRIKEDRHKQQAEQLLQRKKAAKLTIDNYLQTSGLTDEKFAQQLINWHIPPEKATLLRDEHITKTPKQIWQLIRDNYTRLPKNKQ